MKGCVTKDTFFRFSTGKSWDIFYFKIFVLCSILGAILVWILKIHLQYTSSSSFAALAKKACNVLTSSFLQTIAFHIPLAFFGHILILEIFATTLKGMSIERLFFLCSRFCWHFQITNVAFQGWLKATFFLLEAPSESPKTDTESYQKESWKVTFFHIITQNANKIAEAITSSEWMALHFVLLSSQLSECTILSWQKWQSDGSKAATVKVTFF